MDSNPVVLVFLLLSWKEEPLEEALPPTLGRGQLVSFLGSP